MRPVTELVAGGFLLAALLAPPSMSQTAYTQLKRHEPIWAPSVYGGYYDATGVIQGAVAERDLIVYGGRFADGRPVNGTAKIRDVDGRLLYEDEYRKYRQALADRLARIDFIERQTDSYALSDWQRENLRIERQDIADEIALLDASYRQRTPYSPPASLYGAGSSAYAPYLPAQAKPLAPAWKETIFNRGLQMLGRLGL